MKLPFDDGTPPDHINEEGTKWWKDEVTTRYARNPNSQGVYLDSVTCFFVEMKSGSRTRVLVDEGKIVGSDSALDGIATRIDMLKIVKAYQP